MPLTARTSLRQLTDWPTWMQMSQRKVPSSRLHAHHLTRSTPPDNEAIHLAMSNLSKKKLYMNITLSAAHWLRLMLNLQQSVFGKSL
jgi:hypothetical protein